MFQDFTSSGVRVETEPREQRKADAVLRQMQEDRITESGVLLMRVDTSNGRRPKGSTTQPPMRATGLPLDLASELVIRLNRQSIHEDRHCWSVVAGRGRRYGVVTIPLAVTEERPDDPMAFPSGMKMVDSTPSDAGQRRCQINKGILAVARVPKLWAVVVRRPVVGQVPSRV